MLGDRASACADRALISHLLGQTYVSALDRHMRRSLRLPPKRAIEGTRWRERIEFSLHGELGREDDERYGQLRSRLQPSLEQITVADLVRFLLWLPADEREKVVDLLRAIQDRRWHETGLEPVIISEA